MRSEIVHHTAEQVAGYLASAIQLADMADLTPEDRAVCLPVLVNLFSAKSITVTQAAPLLDFPGIELPR